MHLLGYTDVKSDKRKKTLEVNCGIKNFQTFDNILYFSSFVVILILKTIVSKSACAGGALCAELCGSFPIFCRD